MAPWTIVVVNSCNVVTTLLLMTGAANVGALQEGDSLARGRYEDLAVCQAVCEETQRVEMPFDQASRC